MPGFEQKIETILEDECRVAGLSAVLEHVAPKDENLRKTLLGIYDSLAYIRQKYFLNPEVKEDGMLILTNLTLPEPEVQNPMIEITGIYGLEPKRITGVYTFHDDSGKKKLEELIYDNGTIIVDAQTGGIQLYAGYLFIGMVPAAIAKDRGVNFSWKELGINEVERKKLGGPTYKGLGMRHLSALSASGLDPNLYAFVQSREAYGTITLFHDYEILFSTIDNEINSKYRNIYDEAKKKTEDSCREGLAKISNK